MNVSMYQAAAAMNALQQWQEITSGNLAASSLPGFKRQVAAFGSQEGGVTLGHDQMLNAPKFALPEIRSALHLAEGQIKHTGVKTDVAIEGEGFFEIQLPSGEYALTRDGEFRFDASGVLVTKGGDAVMGVAGEINMDLANRQPVSISYNGEVSQGINMIGQIRVVMPDNPAGLESIGGGVYRSQNAGAVNDVDEAVVRQGYIEASNTSPVEEMADMINAMRLFQANQKLVHMQDERLGRSITALSSNQ